MVLAGKQGLADSLFSGKFLMVNPLLRLLNRSFFLNGGFLMYHTRRICTAFSWLIVPVFLLISAHAVAAQKKVAQTPDDTAAVPAFHEYKGVSIGMTAEDARKKLGEPQEKGDEQDVYSFSDTESAQVFYDQSHKVIAISINFLGDGTNVPKPKAVLGTELQAKPDGGMHDLVRFPKAGYWASYSRTAGDSPLITITLKRID